MLYAMSTSAVQVNEKPHQKYTFEMPFAGFKQAVRKVTSNQNENTQGKCHNTVIWTVKWQVWQKRWKGHFHNSD